MASRNEIIYDIWEVLRPFISDDDDISKELIGFKLDTLRALYLRNELNKTRSIDPYLEQDLGCVDVELADRADCCDISTDCKIIRTVNKIPKPIELHFSTGITRVAGIDKLTIPFSITPYDRIPYVTFNKFAKDGIFSFILNERIYITGKNDEIKWLEKINIRGIFEDPRAAGKFNHCSGEPCYTDDSQYPMSLFMVNYIKSQLLQELSTKIQMPVDDSNDANSNPKSTN